MAIGKRKYNGGGDYLAIAKWDARLGQIYLEDRAYVRGRGFEKEQRNVPTNEFRAAFDMENLQTGWFLFAAGTPPDMRLFRVGHDIGDAPSDAHRQGLRLLIKPDESLGGGVRELISTAEALWYAIDDLHGQYLAGVAAHAGCLPVVDIAEVREERAKNSVAYAPVFKIVGWLPRPPELPAGGIAHATKVTKTAAPDQNFGRDDPATDFARMSVKDDADFDDEIPF